MSAIAPIMSPLEAIILKIEANDFKEQQIDLRNEDIGDSGVVALVKVLNKHACSVEEIDLAGNNIGDSSAQLLTTVKSLKKLNLNNNHIGPQGVKSLAETALNELDIGSNPIQNEGIQYLSQNKTLLKLEAVGCEISGKGASEFFSTNTSLQELDFSENNIGDEGVTMLHLHPKLQNLSLMHTNLTYQGAEFISRSHLLRVLNLAGNSIVDRGAQALAKTALEEIDITNNGVGDEGIAAFTDSKQLKELIMFGNYVTSTGIKALLAKNKSLSSLNLCCNKVDDECIKELMTSSSLTEVHAFGNGFTDKSVKLINELLKTSSIQRIDISNNVVKKGLFIAYVNRGEPALAPSEIDSKNNSPKNVQ